MVIMLSSCFRSCSLRYLSILLGEVFNFCPALLPGLFIPLVPQLPWNLFKNGPVPAHAIQLVLDVLLAPHTDKSPCSICAPTSSCHFTVSMRTGSTVKNYPRAGSKTLLMSTTPTTLIKDCAYRNSQVFKCAWTHVPLWTGFKVTYGSELRLNRFGWMHIECGRE